MDGCPESKRHFTRRCLRTAPFESAAAKLREILENADTVIAYNDAFERSFLDAYGIESKKLSWGEDPMITFANATGGTKRTLSLAAKFFNFDFDAHNALGDVTATLYIYQRMQGGLLNNLMHGGRPCLGQTPNGPVSIRHWTHRTSCVCKNALGLHR